MSQEKIKEFLNVFQEKTERETISININTNQNYEEVDIRRDRALYVSAYPGTTNSKRGISGNGHGTSQPRGCHDTECFPQTGEVSLFWYEWHGHQ